LQRKVHVTFDAKTGHFHGVPDCWVGGSIPANACKTVIKTNKLASHIKPVAPSPTSKPTIGQIVRNWLGFAKKQRVVPVPVVGIPHDVKHELHVYVDPKRPCRLINLPEEFSHALDIQQTLPTKTELQNKMTKREHQILKGSINPDNVFNRGKKLGQGAFGQVFAAQDLQTNEEYAVKELAMPEDKEIIASLKNEIVVHSIVSFHENIVSLRGAFVFSNNMYVQLEYVKGGSLSGK
jgi:serine/threonine protein kinase